MRTITRADHLRRSGLLHSNMPVAQQVTVSEPERIKQQLLSLGMSRFVLATSEAHYLPRIIHPDENIVGVIYGHSKNGFAMILATDKRIIFLDKKPFFVIEDEITYSVVSGVSHGQAGIGSTVILHTRIKDYKFQTLNERCARGFVAAIEQRCVEYDVPIANNHF